MIDDHPLIAAELDTGGRLIDSTEHQTPPRSEFSRRVFLGGVGAAAAVGATGPAVAGAAPVPALTATVFQAGVGTHFGQNKGYAPANVAAMVAAGVTSIRDEVPWRQVETTAGQYRIPPFLDNAVRQASVAGIAPVLILGYSNPLYDNDDRPTSAAGIAAFAKYAAFVARHFAGIVRHYEVWNEWDIPLGGGNIRTKGDPAQYVALLAAASRAVRAADSRAIVIGGAMTYNGMANGFLDIELAQGMLRYVDGVSLHPYVHGMLPEVLGTPEGLVSLLQRVVRPKLRQANRGDDFPVYLTEVGWPTSLGARDSTQQEAANFCARLLLTARTLSWVKGVWWYDFQDDGYAAGDAEQNFGLTYADLSPKEAYHAFASVAPVVARATAVQRLDAHDADVWALRLTLGADRVVALWSAHPDDEYQLVVGNGGRTTPIQVTAAGRPAHKQNWGWRAWYAGESSPHTNQLSFTVRGQPVLLRGALDRAGIVSLTEHDFAERSRAPQDSEVFHQPDMQVLDVTWSPAAPTSDSAVVFSATIVNHGYVATPLTASTVVHFLVDGVEVSYASRLGAIQPGQSVTVTATGGPDGNNAWTGPTYGPAGIPPGDYQVQATVNFPTGDYGDSNWMDNGLVKTLTVS